MPRPDAPAGAVFVDANQERWWWVEETLPSLPRADLHKLLARQSRLHSVQVVPEPMTGGGHLLADGDADMMWATLGLNPALTELEARSVCRTGVARIEALVRGGWGVDAELDQRIVRPALPAPAVRRDPDTGDAIASGAALPPTPDDVEAATYRLADDVVERVGLYRRYAEQPDQNSRRRFVAEVAAGLAHQRWQAEFTAAGGRLNLAAARGTTTSVPTQAAPARGPGSRVVRYQVDGRPERWLTITPGFAAAYDHQGLLRDLVASGPFTSITVAEGPLVRPRGGNTGGYVDEAGNAHLEVTLADDLDENDRARIMRHELGHVADACAAGDQWADVFADHDTAERVADAFERPDSRHYTLVDGVFAVEAARHARGVTS